MLRRFALALLLMGCGTVQAAVISERPDKVTVTIYHEGRVDTAELAQGGGYGGLALITETRTIDLPAGLSEIQFRGVASTMVPQTADVGGLPNGVLERNFDYDLLSPGALLRKSVGETVHLIRRTGRRSGTEVEKSALVLSGPDGVMLQVDGGFEALNCSGLPERLVFDHVPDGLRDTPTLTVRTNAARAGHYTVTLRYIAVNLNWSADYVARIAADDRTLDLSGWITLANFSDTSFADAPVEVIAGHVETSGNDEAPEPQATPRNDACWPTNINWATLRALNDAPMFDLMAPRAMAPPPLAAPAMEAITVTAAKEIEARNLGDYKLYPLPEPTNVAARQTKQVQFLDRRAVPFERIYGYRMPLRLGSEPQQPLPASILLRLENTERGRLGKPLPAGGISALAVAADGDPYLAGRDELDDIAVGLPLEIAAGQTMAVRAQARLAEHATFVLGGHIHSRDTIEVTLINDKATAAAFEWRQAMEETGVTLVSESRRHGTKNGDLLWAVALAPGARVELRYTLDTPQ
jgi:hypothetical protein